MKKTLHNKTNSAGNSEFLLNIRYHQHNSWQGSVQRLDTGETVNFRSVLELIHLIEIVAGQKATPEEKIPRIRSWRKSKKVDHTILEKCTSG